jgi:hypothetical protein
VQLEIADSNGLDDPAMSEQTLKTRKPSSVDDSSIKPEVDIKSIEDLVDAEPEPFKLYNFLFRRHLYTPQDLDAIATRRSVYDDPEIASYYWPKPEYENIHRFDVKARWTAREERALVRIIDWRVMLWAAISFSALNLDRLNLSQANTDHFLPDLHMTTDGKIERSCTYVHTNMFTFCRLQLGQYCFPSVLLVR